MLQSRFQKRVDELKALTRSVQANCTKAENDLNTLKAEVVKSIQGESEFSSKMLSGMVEQGEEKQYDETISMAEMYDSTNLESRKMIVSRMITRVEVARGYRLNVVFKPEFQEFFQLTNIAAAKIA